MSLRLVTGPFGKGSLCSDARAGADENQRRTNRLAECVTYVDWHPSRRSVARLDRNEPAHSAGAPGAMRQPG